MGPQTAPSAVRTFERTGEAQRLGRSSVEEKPPCTVTRSLVRTVWKTDVFYVEKYTRVYTGGAV